MGCSPIITKRVSLFHGLMIMATTIMMTTILRCDSSNPMFVDPVFEKVPFQGLYVELYWERNERGSPEACAVECISDWFPTRMCSGFIYHPQNKQCQYFKRSADPQSASVHGFLFRASYDVFQDMETGEGRRISLSMSSEQKTHLEASESCNDMGGYLFQFDSLDKYDAVYLFADLHPTSSAPYVGANDIDVDGQWVYDKDGMPIDLTTWIWEFTQPNGLTSENCAILLFSRDIHDGSCALVQHYMCERDV